MRAREPRRKVLIKARMRLGCAWGDVYLLNISSRGLLIQAPEAPSRGTYIEVRRGRHAIAARVAWSEDQRFGVQTQERLKIDEIINEPDLSGAYAGKAPGAVADVERRSAMRDQSPAELGRRGDRNRWAARAGQAACVAIFGASAAFVAAHSAYEALSRPLAHVSKALNEPNPGAAASSGR